VIPRSLPVYAATVGRPRCCARGTEALIEDSGYVLDGEEKLVAAFSGADGIVLKRRIHQWDPRWSVRIPVVETGNLTTDPIDMVVGFLIMRPLAMMPSGRTRHRTIGFIGAAGRQSRRSRIAGALTSCRRARDPRPRSPSSPSDGGRREGAGADLRRHRSDRHLCRQRCPCVGALLECQRRGSGADALRSPASTTWGWAWLVPR
jgi:hypothetical protein